MLLILLWLIFSQSTRALAQVHRVWRSEEYLGPFLQLNYVSTFRCVLERSSFFPASFFSLVCLWLILRPHNLPVIYLIDHSTQLQRERETLIAEKTFSGGKKDIAAARAQIMAISQESLRVYSNRWWARKRGKSRETNECYSHDSRGHFLEHTGNVCLEFTFSITNHNVTTLER